MSAVETVSAVLFSERKRQDVFDYYDIIVNGERVGTVNFYPESNSGIPWQVSLFGAALFGHGGTAREAIAEALGDNLERMQSHINRAKAISIEHGDEILSAAEDLA